jgi:uncharacterized protein YyaL (SSP411 family)
MKPPDDRDSHGGALAGLPSAEEISELPADGRPEFNRLVFETSPYLLQHARNPVDWYPWGDAAFTKAVEEDKPIFLSLGYSTCHWCHVMEEDSFVDPEVGRVLNEGFVAIKVDRETRPDVDHLYMVATQSLAGRGGWPNTLLLTPDLKPFFAATFIPKAQLLDLLSRAREVWVSERVGVEASAGEISAGLVRSLQRPSAGSLSQSLFREAADHLLARFDPEYGGFGHSPKFPTPQNLVYLLRASRRLADEKYRNAAFATLRAMRHGGIYDQVGFGFHRYSTDRTWTIPHFEKMLYDQALAALAYLEAFQASREPFFRAVVEEILTYVDRDLSDSEGGFHCAEDADSDGEEGTYYLWSEEELVAVLGPELGAKAKTWFETRPGGNHADEATGHRTGSNVLRLAIDANLASADLAEIRGRLLAARRKRVPPLKDDKVLCDWNGLMLAAFSRAGSQLNEPKWTARAQRAADFILSTMSMKTGRLHHTYRRGRTQDEPGVQDYGSFLWGLTELIQATGDPAYLSAARDLAEVMIRDFWDPDRGGFFMSGAEATDLLARTKEAHDGAIPSGNGVSAYALSVLARLTADQRYAEYASLALGAFGGEIKRAPDEFVTAMLAYGLNGGADVILVGTRNERAFGEALARLRSVYAPTAVILPVEPLNQAGFREADEFLASLKSINGKPTVYMCRGSVCDLPTTDIETAVASLLQSEVLQGQLS